MDIDEEEEEEQLAAAVASVEEESIEVESEGRSAYEQNQQLAVRLYAQAWESHCEYRWRERAIGLTEVQTQAYHLSWVALMRLFLLVKREDSAKMAQYGPLDDLAYAEIVAQGNSAIMVSHANLEDYGIDKLWQSMRLFHNSMHYYRYTPAQFEYAKALIYRYADVLQVGVDDLL